MCHVISTLSVGRRRPHRIWFNRPGALPPHHVLYILTFVVFGVSMVGCMVARDVHYVDGTLMHRLIGVNHDKLALSWILRRVSCSTPPLGYGCICKEICYQKHIEGRRGTEYWLLYALPPTRVDVAAMVDVWNVICEMWRAWFFVPIILLWKCISFSMVILRYPKPFRRFLRRIPDFDHLIGEALFNSYSGFRNV
jgi:hypothetical protein